MTSAIRYSALRTELPSQLGAWLRCEHITAMINHVFICVILICYMWFMFRIDSKDKHFLQFSRRMVLLEAIIYDRNHVYVYYWCCKAFSDGMNKRSNEPTNERTNERTNRRTDGRTDGRANELANGRTDERNERMNEAFISYWKTLDSSDVSLNNQIPNEIKIDTIYNLHNLISTI